MNKATAILLTAAMLLLAAGCSGDKNEAEEHLPPNALILREQAVDNSTPSGAVAGLLDAVIRWDMGVMAQFMTDVDEADFSAYRSVLLPFIERIEYDLGGEKITDNIAMVDVGITAVDAGRALGDMTLAAARYVLAQSLTGSEIDMQGFVAEYLGETVDFDVLTRTRRTTTVYLIQDSMGRWRLDSTNPDNADFYNALSGGALETVIGLRDLAEEYNFSW